MTRVSTIRSLRLTSADPERLARFYAEAIGFKVGSSERIPAEEMRLTGLSDGGMRIPLTLGEQRVELEAFDRPGRPYPTDATSANLCFQHFAVVTSDAAAAWSHAEAHGARPISRGGPITLPESAGGVTAVKFRDPEGHPLEFLQFPTGTDVAWRGKGVLGIDHTAISVSYRKLSAAFYSAWGLREGDGTHNNGPTQEALDGLNQVELDVVPMRPVAFPPHLELLAYQRPPGSPMVEVRPNDIAATRTVWAADENALVSDPDGHLHLLLKSP